MYYCCTGIAKCCTDTCDCINNTFGQCCTSINQCFEKPFSLCTCMTITFVSIPGVVFAVMGAASMTELSDNCENPIFIFMAVQGLILLLHGLFVYYLFCRYGSKFKPGEVEFDERGKQKTVWQKFTHVLCMDFVVFFYFFLFIFQIVWSIIGSTWLGNETPQCKDLTAYTMAWFMNVVFWIWLTIGFVISFFTLIFMALEEGSCSILSLCYCCISCLTCGICTPKVSKKSRDRRRLRRQKSQGVGKGVLRFFGFGCGSGSSSSSNNRNRNTYNPNANANTGGGNGYPMTQQGAGGFGGGPSPTPAPAPGANYNYPPANSQATNSAPRKKGFFAKFFA